MIAGAVASSLGCRGGQARRVVYIGDSIVLGPGVVPFCEQAESSIARPSRRWINRGINGRRLSAITSSEILDDKPNITIIAAGTNDIGGFSSTLSELQGWIVDLFDALAALGVRVVVGTILPRGLAAPEEATRTGYNAWLVGGGLVGARVADPTVAVELQDPGDTDYYYDGLHPTTAGHAIMAPYYVAAQAGL